MSRKQRRSEQSSKGMAAFVEAFNSGLAHQEAGRLEPAAKAYRRALGINSNVALLHSNYGVVLYDQGEHDQSLVHLRRAIQLDPELTVAHNNMGVTLNALGRYAEAIPSLKRAIEVDPTNASAFNNLGDSYIKLSRFTAAGEVISHSLTLEPNNIQALNNMGSASWGMSRYDDAISYFRRVLALDPEIATAHKNLGIVSLLTKRYAEGWREYEWRFKADKWLMRDHPTPMWSGEPLGDQALYVWNEQGVGDQILYAGMMADLIARNVRVVWEVDERLVSFMQRSYPAVKVVPHRDPPAAEIVAPNVGAQIPIAGLGKFFRNDISQFPLNRQSYLVADAERRAAFRTRLGLSPGEKLVGLSWVSKNHLYGDSKSIKLSAWADILKTPGLRFVDLQYGETAAERAEIERTLGIQIAHLEGLDLRDDLDGVAALADACDLVITVSNTTAHVAAALGRPVWVMIPAGIGKFWYWGTSEPSAAWYPTAVLLRQPESQDWSPVLRDVAERLARFAASSLQT